MKKILVFTRGTESILQAFREWADPNCILFTTEIPTSVDSKYDLVVLNKICETDPPKQDHIVLVRRVYRKFRGSVVDFVKQFLNDETHSV